MRSEHLQKHELGAGETDLALLQLFYQQLYCDAFPDADERESLDNMQDYLQRKTQGWYGPNNYHILLLLDQGQPVAGSVSDYLADACAGVIEFLLVAATHRRRGIGTALLHWTEQTLTADAAGAGCAQQLCIVAEMHNPALAEVPVKTQGDDLSSAQRARLWHDWGYARLDFDYVQPALSAQQQAVRHLWLIGKCAGAASVLDSTRLLRLLHDYMLWAMRIEAPAECVEYQAMSESLARQPWVRLLPITSAETASKREGDG